MRVSYVGSTIRGGLREHMLIYTHWKLITIYLLISITPWQMRYKLIYQVYCLPDNYEVVDHSLWDIQYNLSPYFSREQVQNIDTSKLCHGLDGKEYLSGFVGLNNLKNTDYVNVIIQSLCRVPALRDFLIFHEQQKYTSDVFEF